MNSTETNRRIFPELSAEFYLSRDESVADADEQIAQSFLSLRGEKLNFFRQNLQLGLGKTGRLARMLQFHASAIENEMQGEMTRADFFWRQFLKEIPFTDSGTWSGFIDRCGLSEECKILCFGEDLARTFIGEVAVPFQLGFYAGYLTEVEHNAAAERASLHLKYFADLNSICSGEETICVVFPQVEAVCRLLAERGAIFAALELCEILQEKMNIISEWQTLFLTLKRDLIFAFTQSFADDAEMERPVFDFISYEQEKLRQQWNIFEDNPDYFAVRADLLYLQAVKLANNGEIGAALYASQKVLVFQPLHYQAYELREELLNQIQQIKTQIDEEQDQEMWRVFNRQVNDALEYPASRRAQNTVTARQNAFGLAIWEKIGLAKPKQGLKKKAVALAAAVSEIFADCPENDWQLRAVWSERAAADLDFSDAEREKIFEYLQRSLFDAPAPEIEVPPTPPVFAAAAPVAKAQDVKWNYWLFGPEDRKLKIGTAVCVALVTIIGFFVTYEYAASYLRTRSYSQLREAVQLHDHRRAAAAAADFISYDSFWGEDDRQKHVIGLYDEAVVRLVLEQPGDQLLPETAALVSRHKKLTELRTPNKNAEP